MFINTGIGIIRLMCNRMRGEVRIQNQCVTVINGMTGLVTGKELESTVVAKFKARSKDRLEWATMVELM